MKRPAAATDPLPPAKPSDEADAAAGGGKATRGKAQQEQQQPPMTKRQKLKQRNTKNVWPQQPKIQSMERREAAYLRVAGLVAAPEVVAPPTTTADPSPSGDGPELKFGRLLGGSDQRVRHKTVLQLRSYLTAKCRIPEEGQEAANGEVGVSELDLMKLWKALWHTLYMADKPAVQDELARHLSQLLWCFAGTDEEDAYAGLCYLGLVAEEEEADDEEDSENDDEGEGIDSGDDLEAILEERVHELVEEDDEYNEEKVEDEDSGTSGDEVDDSAVPHCRGAHLASLFVRTFFRTLRREWDRMDKYRIDKFYSLIRYVVREIYRYLALRHWNAGIVALFNDALVEEALRQIPNGIRYHLIDVALEELVHVAASSESFSSSGDDTPRYITEATFLDVLEPYFALAQLGGDGPIGSGRSDDSVQSRAVEKVLLRFLERHSVVRDDDKLAEELDKSRPLVLDQVHVGTVAQFIFDLASDVATKDRYRKSLYDVHKAYLRRLKRAGHRDVQLCHEVASPLPQVDGGSNVEDSDEDVAEEEVQRGGATAAAKLDDGEKSNRTQWNPIQDVTKASKSLSEAPTVAAKEKKEKKHKKKSNDDKQTKKSRKAFEASEKTEGRGTENNDPVNLRGARLGEKQKKDPANQKQSALPLAGNLAPKQKKQNLAPSPASTAATDVSRLVTEQELLITIQAQRAAKAALQQREEAERRVQRESDRGGAGGGDGKRVKFRAENRSRSWTLSMKGLREMQSPVNSNVTPERGILRNKDAKIRKKPANKPQAKRRRAVDYF